MKLTGIGRFIVSVNGVDLPGGHNFEREAIERAVNLELADPSAVVEYRNELRVRVEAQVAAPVPVPAPAPSADVLWKWDATSVAPFGIHAKDPSRVTLVTAGGRPAVRLLTLPGDNKVNGSGDWERCDLRLANHLSDATEGREWWFKHSIWFPDDYAELPQSPQNPPPWYAGSVMNWHDDADSGGSQGPLQLQVFPPTATSPDRSTGLHFEVYGGVGGGRLGGFPVVPIVRNRWFDFIYHIRWTGTSAGFADGWLDGKQFMKHMGPTLHAGHGAYLKLANYHSAHGKASAVLHGPCVRSRTEAGLG